MGEFQEKANFIWQVADGIHRGTFKPLRQLEEVKTDTFKLEEETEGL